MLTVQRAWYPGHSALMNATLLAAEQDWRAGVDPIQIQSRVEAELTELARQFARVKSEQRLPLRSLALEESQGRVPIRR